MPPAVLSTFATASGFLGVAATARGFLRVAATARGFLRVAATATGFLGVAATATVLPCGIAASAVEPDAVVGAARIAVLVDDLPTASGLAVTADGALLACLDGATGTVLVMSPRVPAAPADPERAPRPEIRRIALSGRDGPRPQAIAFVDSRTLAAVCRAGDDWSLHTWRFEADGAAGTATPVQAIPLGRAAGQAEGVGLAVGQGYRWLVVSGLPSPLEPLQLAAMVGGRIGPLSSRRSPRLPAGGRPVAATVGPRDELVLVERRAVPAEDEVISFHATTGGCLLRLDAELAGIRGIASSPGDGGLWAVVGESAMGDARPAGLWRLDAALDAGRQVIAPKLVLPLQDPRWIVSVPEPTPPESRPAAGLVVIHDTTGGRRVVRIDGGAAARDAMPHEGLPRQGMTPEGR